VHPEDYVAAQIAASFVGNSRPRQTNAPRGHAGDPQLALRRVTRFDECLYNPMNLRRPKMAEIRIDAAKAERMISQILRDEKGMLSADAKAFAANIYHRLSAAMPTPTNPPLAGYRIISKHPPRGDSAFNVAVAKKFAEAKDELFTANTLWELVYDQGHDLPPNVVDPR
jgi:hypothetical protein